MKHLIKVRVFYPETAEGIEKLKESRANVMIEILEKQIGAERLNDLINYAKIKYSMRGVEDEYRRTNKSRD